MIHLEDWWPPQLRTAVVRSILYNAQATADFANDNEPQISGAKAHSWPAMRLNAGEGNEQNRALLSVLAELFELAAMPVDNVASAAGEYGSDGELALAGRRDEVAANDDGTPGNSGYEIEYRMRDGTELRDIVAAAWNGSYCTILPDGRRGGEHNPHFKVNHSWEEILVDGDIVPIKFRSQAWYKAPGKWRCQRGGKWRQDPPSWRPVRSERFTTPRGQDPKSAQEYKVSSSAVYPSGNAGATHVAYAADDPVDARKILDRLREAIGEEAFEILRMAVVDRLTARNIGEVMGSRYNAASALGAALIRKALQAANDNFAALAKAA